MLLRKTIETLPFVRGSKFEETKTKLLVRNSNRTVLQENLEKYFNSKRIIFKRRKKPTEIEVKGSDQVLIFKPLKAKGVGGLKFEDQLKNDLNEWFAGAELNELKHKDTIELLVKTIKLKQDSGYKAEKVGTANTKRPPSIAGGRLTVTNIGNGNVSDVFIIGRTIQV